ncbi:NUDIX hydrolase [Nocardioidaceae bacterium SCSIO 66511]|nr:NUDIX hydrolase [Nocardioidaceae bacterium SCSIO 66511]
MTDRAAHPSLPGLLYGADEPIVDRPGAWPVRESRDAFRHPFLSLSLDTVEAPDGDTFERVYVRHKGAVGVVALDDHDRVLLLEQYRHPTRSHLVEVPAGVLDVEGEDPRDAAARELAEEADLVAHNWDPLLRMYSSPGFSDEQWYVYLARGLSAVPEPRRHERVHEEAHMTRVWAPLDDVVRAALAGEIADGMAVAGVLAASARMTVG